ncbi:MFS transporter [Streptomyces sp. NPDC002643]
MASFGGLLLVYGVATWLPTLMRGEGYELGSALTFVVLFNLGGIVGMLVAGRAADCFGAPRISAIWFALTAAGVFLLSARMPLGVTFLVVFLTGVFLNSAQTMIYATVSIRSAPENRATAVGWTSGMGRFGAVFGPWLGGQLLAAGHGNRGFTAFALSGISSTVFIGIASTAGGRPTVSDNPREVTDTDRLTGGGQGQGGQGGMSAVPAPRMGRRPKRGAGTPHPLRRRLIWRAG